MLERVLGIDPGTRRLGFGVVERDGTRLKPLAHGVIDVNKIADFDARLLQLAKEIHSVIDEFLPTRAALEEVFHGRNAKTALRSAEGRGAVRLAVSQRGLAIAEYSARSVKKAVTGRGGSDKRQVSVMVQTILGLRSEPREDAADALAVAICDLQHKRSDAH